MLDDDGPPARVVPTHRELGGFHHVEALPPGDVHLGGQAEAPRPGQGPSVRTEHRALEGRAGSSVTSSFNDSAAVAGSIREMAVADSAAAVGLGSDHLIEARVIRQPVAGNGDPGQRLPRVPVADHARDRLRRGRGMPELGPVVRGDRVVGIRQSGDVEGLSRTRHDLRIWLTMVGPSSFATTRRSRPMPASRIRPSASAVDLGAGAIVTRGRYSPVELVLCPLLPFSASSQGPMSSLSAARISSTWSVAPGTGFPSRSTTWPVIGRVVDQLEGQVVAPASSGDHHPGEARSSGRRRDDGLLLGYFPLSTVSGWLSARKRKRPSGPVVAESGEAYGCHACGMPASGRSSRRRPASVRPSTFPPRRSCQALGRAAPGCGTAASAFLRRQDPVSRPTSAKAPPGATPGRPTPPRDHAGGQEAAVANVSFWSHMILITSRVNSLAAADTTPTVIE